MDAVCGISTGFTDTEQCRSHDALQSAANATMQ
jgi:hypothetical protein